MKKFVNFRFVVTLVLAVFANVVTYAQDNVVDEVVWVVGDEAILKSDPWSLASVSQISDAVSSVLTI